MRDPAPAALVPAGLRPYICRMAERTCHCGHRIGDPEIQEEPEYTTWGWIMLSMFGMTPRPDHIVYRCVLCRKDLGTSRDPKLLHQKTVRAK